MEKHSVGMSNFPEFPPYEGCWAAFYYEPIPTSGERLTIAVVAWDADGHSLTETIPRGLLPVAMQCMIELLVPAITRQFETGGIEAVSMPGIYVGPVRRGMGNDRDDVLQQGVSLTSSIARTPLGV
ncbi:hypothetical protein [Pseudomonas baetica]|uniref:hypothetical protein n=1 Tax=Pseudomonas baetica TaxID=674054 RepID=UPI002404C280|nr:hypothetical protein [Pseudomonas baetica]MDF9778760.1 hypothetical protein [Pseudomonas baetica]